LSPTPSRTNGVGWAVSSLPARRITGVYNSAEGMRLLGASGEEFRGVLGDLWCTSTGTVESPSVFTVNPNPTLRSASVTSILRSDAAGPPSDVAGDRPSSAIRQCSSGWNSFAIVRLAGTQCAGGVLLMVHSGRTLRSSTFTKSGSSSPVSL